MKTRIVVLGAVALISIFGGGSLKASASAQPVPRHACPPIC
jgi:hypothetical protein